MDYKKSVKEYWNSRPCHSAASSRCKDRRIYFDEVERRRYEAEPFIKKLLGVEDNRYEMILDVGCGMGIDLLQFARQKTKAYGVDLSFQSITLAYENFAIKNINGGFINGDAENLPFKDNLFDFVYSWGCLHHTPDTYKAIGEIYRVLRPNGTMCAMIYNKFSLLVFRLYILNFLFKRKRFMSLDKFIAISIESVGTKAYAVSEAKKLFSKFNNIEVRPIITLYDRQISQRMKIFIPGYLSKYIPNRLGWFIVVKGTK